MQQVLKKLIFLLAVLILILAVGQTYRLFPEINLEKYLNLPKQTLPKTEGKIEKQNLVYEESAITKVVEESLPSVVTVGILKTTTEGGFYEIDPFNPFSPFYPINRILV